MHVHQIISNNNIRLNELMNSDKMKDAEES